MGLDPGTHLIAFSNITTFTCNHYIVPACPVLLHFGITWSMVRSSSINFSVRQVKSRSATLYLVLGLHDVLAFDNLLSIIVAGTRMLVLDHHVPSSPLQHSYFVQVEKFDIRRPTIVLTGKLQIVDPRLIEAYPFIVKLFIVLGKY